MSKSKLFQPYKLGDVTLAHRAVMAPLTRLRAYENHVPGPLLEEYYAQRGSVPGTMLVTEATFISPGGGGYGFVPGLWTDEQLEGWKKVTDAVHAKGSFIYAQLWALGRAADPKVLEKDGLPYISSSPTKMTGKDIEPRELSVPEIKQFVQEYATAASNAVHKAGFDGVEIHGAHGYLIDQFLQDLCNKRTDEYGGSVENRCRFALEVVDAVVKAVGPTKTGIRISPWSRFQDMAMADPIPTFSYFTSKLAEKHPDFAFLHVVEPRVDGSTTREGGVPEGQSNDFIRKIWAPRPLISAGAYTRETGIETADQKGDLIAYGRLFISNPDLPLRLQRDIPLVKGDRSTYYIPGPSLDGHGYTDYPFADVSNL